MEFSCVHSLFGIDSAIFGRVEEFSKFCFEHERSREFFGESSIACWSTMNFHS